jgi:Ala-tRNA(Pro) deacylase
MATRRIREFLNDGGVSFGTINHPRVFTTQEVAQASNVPGKYMAKSVVVRMDGRLAIAVVPATVRLDLNKLKVQSGARVVRLAEESEFRNQFEGCQTGAAPPFGNLFGMKTFLDRHLLNEGHIAFNAGTHTDIFMIRFSDYFRLVRPLVVDIAVDSNPRVEQHQMQCGCTMLHHAGSD